MNPIERFERLYVPEPNSGCWLWLGSVCRRDRPNQQYGKFHLEKRDVYAHRFSYEYYVGPIPAGLDLMHRCDTPSCVNPSHLKPGTARDNTQDAIAKGRHKYQVTPPITHCKRGHEYTPDNSKTKFDARYTGGMKRECRECDKARKRARFREAKEQQAADIRSSL